MRTTAVAEPSAFREPAARVPQVRSRITNSPLARANGNTAEGRRLRDLMRAYTAALGNPTDPGTQAEIIRAAELVVAAEAARAAYLAKPGDPSMLDPVIRLENLSARALRRLGIEHGKREEPPRAEQQPVVLAGLEQP
jgi:hypothetical protein